MTILILNAGSSSLKFSLVEMPAERHLLAGRIEGIGSHGAALLSRTHSGESHEYSAPARDYSEALALAIDHLQDSGLAAKPFRPDVVGHRIVHGGATHTSPALINDEVYSSLESLKSLAPLHNSVGLAVVAAVTGKFPTVPQVAVFDTAFHQCIPEYASLYGLPLGFQRKADIRRYGFHGLSHEYVASKAARWLDRPLDELKVISLHLGSGASACAVAGGRSVDTSMGFTPLEGLVMGTRCGDLDPALPAYLGNYLGLDEKKLEQLLHEQSGLLGLCGDADMRRIEMRREAGDAEASLAFDIFCYRIRKYIGAYYAVLNGLDVLIFTAGIGERSAGVRKAVCKEMDALGIGIDPVRNGHKSEKMREIGSKDFPVRILVVPTDEEMAIARASYQCCSASADTRLNS